MSLPKGYKMWIYPTYRLETPQVTITLPNDYGAILAMLVGRYREPVFLGETMAALHGTPEDGGPVSCTQLIQQHVDYLRNYLRQYGVVATIKTMPGHDCAALRYIKHVGTKAEQTPYVRLNRKPTRPRIYRVPGPVPAGSVIPYARHARQELAEQCGHYERPMTNEEITQLERQR